VTLTPVERIDADVAVVGSGFSGSLVALALKRRGRRVVLVERGRHPRFAIGESSTPLANLLLEELADRYDLPRIRPFSKWGTWQRERPDVAAGLKRGFTFFFHRTGEPFADTREHDRQLLVAASPHNAIGDTHWYRPDFDHALVREAESAGVVYLDEVALDRFSDHGSGASLEGTRHGRSLRISAAFVIDATGPRGFLHQTLGLEVAPLRWLPPTEGLYSHFEGVERWDQLMPSAETPPYPPDTAALHHVFPGGWIWVLRFNNGITSAGAALTPAPGRPEGLHYTQGQTPVAHGRSADLQVRPADREPAWRRLLATLPSVRDQFANARAVLPFVHAPRLAFRTRHMCGTHWAMLPSAAGVIDPLLSTGFPLTLLGIGRLLDVLEGTADGAEREAALNQYARDTQDELDVTEQLVGALYANMTDPAVFKRLSLLYFAAASYSEAARRLGRPELAPGFLLHDHPRFGGELRRCAALAADRPEGAGRGALLDRIDRAIEPFDTAGLLDDTRRSWYPVLADDLIDAAPKLHATVDDIHRLLERCGYGPTSK
jgi:FADH2 O2-dependent halogenase